MPDLAAILVGLDELVTQLESTREAVLADDAERLAQLGIVADRLNGLVTDSPEDEHRWDDALRHDDELFANALTPLFELDHHGFVIRTNLRTDELIGIPGEELIGEHVGRFIHPQDYDTQADFWVRMLVDPTFDAVSSEVRIVTVDGVSWQRVALKAARNEHGELLTITAHLSDLNDKYEAEAALDRSQRQFGNLLDHLPIPVIRLNRLLHIEFGNPAAQRIRQSDAGGAWPSVGTEDQDLLLRSLNEVLRTGESTTIQHTMVHRGMRRWCESTIVAEPYADGSVKSLLMFCRDITGQRRHEAELAHQARHDALTGLPNRARFAELLERSISRQRAEIAAGHTREIAVLFLDLDRFKVVNDSLGHAAGDELLTQVAQRLSAAVRPGDMLGRLGGDEFTVLAEAVSEEDALALAERLMAQLRIPFELEGRQFIMSSSIGVVSIATPEQPSDLMRWADSAMYRAKHQGRDRVVLFDDVLRYEALEQLDLDQALRRALEHDEFTVLYQPEVRVADGAITGAEALIRWNHPSRGRLDAGEFIPLAEENGTVVAIDHAVMRTACQQVVDWQRDGLVEDDFVVRVNISARQLELSDLAAAVAVTLEQTGLNPGCLCLEITETALMRDVDRALEVLTDLHRAGIQLAVDDFGTGYSSLSSLKRFPLHVLKIDRSFVGGLPDDTHDAAIVTTVLRLAETLGLAATAEGVETAEQLERLDELGCSSAQGYLFSRPVPAEEFEALVADGQPLTGR